MNKTYSLKSFGQPQLILLFTWNAESFRNDWKEVAVYKKFFKRSFVLLMGKECRPKTLISFSSFSTTPPKNTRRTFRFVQTLSFTLYVINSLVILVEAWCLLFDGSGSKNNSYRFHSIPPPPPIQSVFHQWNYQMLQYQSSTFLSYCLIFSKPDSCIFKLF